MKLFSLIAAACFCIIAGLIVHSTPKAVQWLADGMLALVFTIWLLACARLARRPALTFDDSKSETTHVLLPDGRLVPKSDCRVQLAGTESSAPTASANERQGSEPLA